MQKGAGQLLFLKEGNAKDGSLYRMLLVAKHLDLLLRLQVVKKTGGSSTESQIEIGRTTTDESTRSSTATFLRR